MKKYHISKKECEAKIGILVCEGCGGKLEALETTNNAHEPTFWVGCNQCSCFRAGTLRQYFEIARFLVESGEMIPYRHLQKSEYESTPERLNYWFDLQTAGLSNQIRYIHKLINEKFFV